MLLTSPAFHDHGAIPEKYTCDGENINPPLEFSEVPASAKSLVLIVDDPDAPAGIFTHWIVWNIDPLTTLRIEENSIPAGAEEGTNDFGKAVYGGPCPPSGSHRYEFKLFALDRMISLPSDTTKTDIEATIRDHILERAELIGVYARK